LYFPLFVETFVIGFAIVEVPSVVISKIPTMFNKLAEQPPAASPKFAAPIPSQHPGLIPSHLLNI
jgi:hypothetical protein